VDRWNTHFGLNGAITYRDLDSHFDQLDKSLSVRPVADEIIGNHNSLFGEAAQKLGIRADRITRYDGGCEASASCITGCRTAKKLSMNVTYIPQSLHRGARIYTSAYALNVESRYGRITGVRAKLQAPGSPILFAIARRGVIVAASAAQTPGVLARSKIKLPALGKHFQAHPGSSLTGRFKQPISMDFGATQGFNSTHFVETNSFKIEALSLPPELLSVRIPGVGPEFMEHLLDFKHLLNWAIVVKAKAEGKVISALGRTFVQYTPSPTDMIQLRRGLRTLSEMMFATGAVEIRSGVYGMPTLRSPDDLRYWDDASLDPRAYGLMISHLFGSTRMGPDPKSSVVGLDFQVHGMRGLYVLDSSIFPTNLGVNPQHTIMAVARLGATRIVENPLPASFS
jgi:choline dehydrogenase-like flavoprotein